MTDTTAYAIVGGKRYTSALCRVTAQMTMDQVLKRLVEPLDRLGINVSVLRLDRGFYSVKVMRALIDRKQPCIMPAVRRGKSPTQSGGPTGTSVMAQWTCRAWTAYTLNTQTDARFADKTREALAFEPLRRYRTYVIVYARGYFEIFETLSFAQLALQLLPLAQDRSRHWLDEHLHTVAQPE